MQNIMISLPLELSKGVILHHLYIKRDMELILPGNRKIAENHCAVIWTRDGNGQIVLRDWAKKYFESEGREWDIKYWWSQVR